MATLPPVVSPMKRAPARRKKPESVIDSPTPTEPPARVKGRPGRKAGGKNSVPTKGTPARAVFDARMQTAAAAGKDKNTLDPLADLPKTLMDPLEFLVATMNDPQLDRKDRIRCAIAAARYKHRSKDDGGVKQEREEKGKAVAAKGKFATPKAPKALRDVDGDA